MPNRAGISYPKARSIVSSQRGPRQQAPQGHLPALKPLKPLKLLKRLKRLRPDPSLLLGGPACRSLGDRSQQAPQGHINGFFSAVHANRDTKALKPLKPLKRLKRLRPDPSLLLGGPAFHSPGVRSQQAPQGHINGFLLASKPAVCQPAQASKCTPKPDQWLPLGVQACRLPPFSFTTPSLTENWFPHTVRWSICPVFTSLATFPLQAGQT